MRRKQWVLVGTGVLSVGALSLGAMGVANAMQVQDAAGAPVSGVELRGEIVAPSPTAVPGVGERGTEQSHEAERPAAEPPAAEPPAAEPPAAEPPAAEIPAPVPQPVPAPAPAASAASVASPVSAHSAD